MIFLKCSKQYQPWNYTTRHNPPSGMGKHLSYNLNYDERRTVTKIDTLVYRECEIKQKCKRGWFGGQWSDRVLDN